MTRPATFILALAASWAIIAAGCGSGDGDPKATPTGAAATTVEAGASPGGQQSTATLEPSPEPSATVPTEPVTTPTPAITELTFDMANSGSGTNTAASTGPLGVVYATASFRVDAARNRALASAFVNIGVNERPSASAYLVNQFRAPGEGTSPITAQISTGVKWQGVLAGNGAGGTRAAVLITVSVLEDSKVIATEKVHELEQREAALTIGGFDDIDRADVDMEVSVVPGRLYELRMTVTCAAASGIVGVATHCVYGSSDFYDDGYVEWEPRTILFTP